MELLHEPPQESSFTPLPEHQAQTPQSFYSGPPVLYHRSQHARLLVSKTDAQSNPAISKLLDSTTASHPADDDGEADAQFNISDVDVWVTSETFLLFRPSTSSGLSIPYPSISLHAIQRTSDPATNASIQTIYLQISTLDGFDDHDPDATLEFTIIPADVSNATAEDHTSAQADGTQQRSSSSSSPPQIQELYAALSECSNLHPDPVSSEEGEEPSYVRAAAGFGANGELGNGNGGGDGDVPVFEYEVGARDGGLPPPMPGSGGWITADNVGEFFDEEGNWRGGWLGPGAGMVRSRDEDEGADGVVEDADGDGDETKWRRTG